MHIKVKGAIPKGTVIVSGNKNAALPVIAASMLSRGKVVLHNIPNIVDVQLFIEFLKSIGVKVTYSPQEEKLELDYSRFKDKKVIEIREPGRLSKIRAVILLLAALVTRFEKVVFRGFFTGCSLGSRPLTVHFRNLERLGVIVKISSKGIILKRGRSGLGRNSYIYQKEQSVTATEVAMIVSMGRRVQTTIYNAACEPHVQDLALFLKSLGAVITGEGTNRLVLKPPSRFAHKVEFAIHSDHHELATFLAISSVQPGSVNVIHNLSEDFLLPFDSVFNTFGYKVVTVDIPSKEVQAIYEKNANVLPKVVAVKGGVRVSKLQRLEARSKYTVYNGGYITIKPHPWPGLPVDLLPLFVPLAAYHTEPILFHNWMYDGGLFWTLELRKAGVKVLMADPHRVLIHRGKQYRGATFEAPYIIRATIALVIFALSLKQESIILNADTIYRAHPNFIEKLNTLGVVIEKI